MGTLKNKDDIVWVLICRGSENLAFSVNTPYLYDENSFCSGKLMYSTILPFGANSITLNDNKGWYKVAYSMSNEKQVPKTDEEIQCAGNWMGLCKGVGLDRSLSKIPAKEIYKIISSGKPSEVISDFCEPYAQNFFMEIAEHYEINDEDIKIAGGLRLFPKRLDEAHDIDVVITVDSEKALSRLAVNPRPVHGKDVFEYGKYWPLRWRSKNGYLVCPFFVAGALVHQVEGISLTKKIWRGSLTIKDMRYSLFEIMVLETAGYISWVVMRKGSIRGEFFAGQSIYIKGTICQITEGSLKGERAVFIDTIGVISVK